MRVIVNTSPLIALDRIGRLGLLRQLFVNIVRPQAVLDELLAGRHRHEGSKELYDAEWISTEPNPHGMNLRKELGAGETAVIILAMNTQADLVLLDDLQARIVAVGVGLQVAGTLGLVQAACDAALIPDAKVVFNELQRCGFRMPHHLL